MILCRKCHLCSKELNFELNSSRNLKYLSHKLVDKRQLILSKRTQMPMRTLIVHQQMQKRVSSNAILLQVFFSKAGCQLLEAFSSEDQSHVQKSDDERFLLKRYSQSKCTIQFLLSGSKLSYQENIGTGQVQHVIYNGGCR